MKPNKDLILSFSFNDSHFEFFKLKTIRGTNIFFDSDKNFYASWDDLWHVLNNMSPEKKYHWTQLNPNYIAKDYKRLIINNLNKHKSIIGVENLGDFHTYWSKWEEILFEEGSTVELDISNLNNPLVKSISIDYNQLLKVSDINEILNNLIDFKILDYSIVNLSSGKKILGEKKINITSENILPGDLLKIYLNN